MSEPATQPPLTPEPDPPADPPKDPPAKDDKGALTQYVILASSSAASNSSWSVVKAVQEARSSKAAVQAYLDGIADKDGTYVAVPVRSWDPITVKTETTTRLVFS